MDTGFIVVTSVKFEMMSLYKETQEWAETKQAWTRMDERLRPAYVTYTKIKRQQQKHTSVH